MRWRRFWQCLLILLVAVLAWSPALPVVAQDPPPPAPILRAQPSTLAPAQPAAGQAVLYDQMDSAGTNLFILSQNSTLNAYDTRAADNFFVNLSSSSWHITAVEVAGHYDGGSGSPSISSVNVAFYADSGGLPGYLLYTANAVPISGTASTGNFYLPLSPPVDLASNANYWVSVQAIQSTNWYWYWRERTIQTLGPAVWQNPNNGFSTGCLNWTAVNICFPNTGPDLLFRLYGTQSASHVTPVLLSLDPNSAFNRTFTLNAHGVGFANGAVLNFGATHHFSTAVSGSTNLSALVPASAVSGSYNSTLTVTVTNPGPCSGSCTSNALIFTLANRTYLPVVRR